MSFCFTCVLIAVSVSLCRSVWSSCAGCQPTCLQNQALSFWWCCVACVLCASLSWCLRWGRWCEKSSKDLKKSSWWVQLIRLCLAMKWYYIQNNATTGVWSKGICISHIKFMKLLYDFKTLIWNYGSVLSDWNKLLIYMQHAIDIKSLYAVIGNVTAHFLIIGHVLCCSLALQTSLLTPVQI